MPSEFAHRHSFSLFGVSIEVIAESSAALSAVAACDLFNNDGAFVHDDDLSVYVVLRSYGVNEPLRREPDHVDGSTLVLHFGDVAARADVLTRRGLCIFPGGNPLGDDFAEAFRTVVLYLVAQAGRTPVHAAAFMLGETAIVLAGPSGSGKSTLALAAARSGLAVLAEDTVFVQERPTLRLWSNASAIHVFPRDAPQGSGGAMRFRTGRWKRAIPLATRRSRAERAMLCVLERGDGLSLTPVAPDDAVHAVTARLEPGYDFYGARGVEAVRQLASGGAWRLTLSASPDDAIELIRRTFG